MTYKLTIGMAHHNDFDGLYFTIQDILKELTFSRNKDMLTDIEFVIVENCLQDSKHKDAVREHSRMVPNCKYVDGTATQGAAASKNLIFEHASGDFVLVMDCHVLLCPARKVICHILEFIYNNADSKDLYSGPLVYDDLHTISTHFNDVWSGQMWGQWGDTRKCNCGNFYFSSLVIDNKIVVVDVATQQQYSQCPSCSTKVPNTEMSEPYARSEEDKPFPIFAQGMGLFLSKRDQWLGYHADAIGFGGEEICIHTRYRQAGRQCICLPFMKWMHRFKRPAGVTYPLTLFNKVRNYMLEFNDLGLDLQPLYQHFVEEHGFGQEYWDKLLAHIQKDK